MKKIMLFGIIVFMLTACHDKTYTVTFDTNGGTLLDSISVVDGEMIEDVPLPEKDGYIFVNWEKDGMIYNEKSSITEDIILVAKWTKVPDLSKEYKIIFDVNGKLTEETVKYKELLKKPKDPTLKYYKFIGWYLENELYDFDKPVIKDLYLIAKFEKKIFTITFDLDGGSGLTETKVEAGGKISKPPVPTRMGYKFIGWYYLGKSYNFNSTVVKNITLKAKWEAISYVTVRYLTDGGTVINSEIILRGEKAPKPKDPVKEGYEFKYWQYNGSEYDFDSKVEEPIELIAVYQEETSVHD